jgi:predicted cupin superfamily sugar epimerase
MSDRADELRRRLELAPHPEGGWYRETHRSPHAIEDPSRGTRSAVTVIDFLLTKGETSIWHRVTSEEIWHYQEGASLELMTIDPASWHASSHMLGPLEAGHATYHVVPAHWWQAARPTGDYTLVACSVAPGFEFADFTMLRDDEASARTLAERCPELVDLL